MDACFQNLYSRNNLVDMKKSDKAEYSEKMCKRAAELVKSGWAPGAAVQKARSECGMSEDIKMKAPPADGPKLNITKKNDGSMGGASNNGAQPSGGQPF